MFLPTGLLLAWFLTSPAGAEIHKFKTDQPGTRNFGVWRLTNDPAVQDEGNYHNIQCWSSNGRFTCYTHWEAHEGPGGKASAEIHVIDLWSGKDILVGRGINPRWANHHNWLFYCHWTQNGKQPYDTGTQVIRYDADTGEKVVITHGVEIPGSLDSTDTWLYGAQRYRWREPPYTIVRVRNRPGSQLEVIEGAPGVHSYVHVNPVYPVIFVRARDYSDKIYGMNRPFFDLDGSNIRKGAVIIEEGHMSWSGDGKYLLMGNRQVRGRAWNKPFPNDLEIFSHGGVGDICPCGKSGRYICGGDLSYVDTRSGDQWAAVYPRSHIIHPLRGDHSSGMDIDPKGSPDGTKIHYHSTRSLDTLATTKITKFDPKQPDIIHVGSTDGFPDSGDLVCRVEVIGYKKKTSNTFEGITRRKYGTFADFQLGSRKANLVLPLSSYVLPEKDRSRAKPNPSMIRAKLPLTHPLMFQNQTDCYVVVARLPFRPHLRLRRWKVELVPGESHWETAGYRILRDGRPLKDDLFRAGESFRLPGPGTYTAVAVEWSRLESLPSLPLELTKGAKIKILEEVPKNFSWTKELWKISKDDKVISRKGAMKADEASMQLVHMHDGVIAREQWRSGQKFFHVDLNEQGKPIRHLDYEDGRLKVRMYKNPEGYIRSEEFFGPDGFKTDYITYMSYWYYTRDDLRGRESSHWWYDRGKPVKMTKRRRVQFDFTKPSDEPHVTVEDTGYWSTPLEDGRKIVLRNLAMDTGAIRYAFEINGRDIGMSRPTSHNFYGRNFFTVSVGKEKFFARGDLISQEDFKEQYVLTQLVRKKDFAELIATQHGEAATVKVRLKTVADEDRLRFALAVEHNDAPKPVTLSFLTYPSAFAKRIGHKSVVFSSSRKLEQKHGENHKGERTIQPGETWLYASDVTQGNGKPKYGGGCGILWSPDEISAGEIDIDSYSVQPHFTLKPGASKAHLSLWDLGKLSSADALARMKALSPAGE